MIKKIFSKKYVLALFTLIVIINACSFYFVDKAFSSYNLLSSMRVISNDMVKSNDPKCLWNDISITFDKEIKYGSNYKSIRLYIGNKLIPITTRLNNSILYIHPSTPYIFNKKYTVSIPANAICSATQASQTIAQNISFSTHNIAEYNILGTNDFMTSAKEFYNFMINNYPFINMTKSVTGFDFQKNKNFIINTLALSKDEKDFNLNLAKILNKLIPGTHTKATNLTIYAPSDFMYIYIAGEYVVISSTNPEIHIGEVVTKINGQNIDNYVALGDNAIISNVDMLRKKVYANTSTFLYNTKLNFTIMNDDKKENNFYCSLKKFDNGAYVYLQPAKPTTSDITTSIIDQDKTAYMKVPTFTVLNFKKVDDFLGSIRNYKNLIIDVRNNNGGDLGFSKQLINRVIQKPDVVTNYICLRDNSLLNNRYKQYFNFYDKTEKLSTNDQNALPGLPYYIKNGNYDIYRVKINLNPTSNHFNGKVYVLTNNSCFSACEYFCNTLKRVNAATLIGGYTGGDGILFIPDSKTFLYDIVNMSYSYTIGMEENGTINQLNHTKPDYYVEQGKEDYINYLTLKGDFSDYDTVLNKCLDIIDQDTAK